MSNKQTSVDKIKLEIEKIKALAQDKADKNSDRPMSEAVIEANACIDVCNHLLLTVLPLSKELEKQQIAEAYYIGDKNGCGCYDYCTKEDSEQYYKETYEQ